MATKNTVVVQNVGKRTFHVLMKKGDAEKNIKAESVFLHPGETLEFDLSIENQKKELDSLLDYHKEIVDVAKIAPQTKVNTDELKAEIKRLEDEKLELLKKIEELTKSKK